jgi:hypothetical protein
MLWRFSRTATASPEKRSFPGELQVPQPWARSLRARGAQDVRGVRACRVRNACRVRSLAPTLEVRACCSAR